MEVISLCSTIGANTGRIKCDIARGIPKFILLGDAVIEKADLASPALFKAALIAATQVASGEPGKLFPLPEIQSVTNSTEAPTDGTLGLGFKFELRAGRPTYVFGFLCGINLETRLREFHNQTVPVQVIDDARVDWGIEDEATEGFKGADAQISVVSRPFQDGNTAEAVLTQVTISYVNADDFNYPAVVRTNLRAGDLEGLLDIQLKFVSRASNAWTYSLTVDNVEIANPLTLPAATLANITASLLSAKSGPLLATNLPITSVAIVGKNVVVTYDSTTYTALASNTLIELALDPPVDLAAAGVVGIEGIPDVTPKP